MVRFAPPDRQNTPVRPNAGQNARERYAPSAAKGKFDEKASEEVRDRVLERLKRMHQTTGAPQDPSKHINKAPVHSKASEDPTRPQRKTAAPPKEEENAKGARGEQLPEQRVQHVHVMCRPPMLGSSITRGGGAVDEAPGAPTSTLMGSITRKIGGPDWQQQHQQKQQKQQQHKMESLGNNGGSSALSVKWLVPSPSAAAAAAASSDPNKRLLQQPSTEPRPRRQHCQGGTGGGTGGDPLECRRLQEELQSCRGQLSALQEEVEARKELDAAREVAMERLTGHAEEQEQRASEAQALNLQLHEELEQLGPWVEKAQLVAQHASGLAAAVRAIMAECNYSSVAGIRDLRADELMLLDKETLDSELGVLAGGLEDCLAALQGDREKQREAGDEAARLRERIGALTEAKEAAEARGRQLRDAAVALEEELGQLRGISAEQESALRRETEESVLESKVAKMMDAHQSALERFQEGLQATEAAHEKQAAAERDLQEANQQLQEEREARGAAVSQLRDALAKEREGAGRLRWEKEGLGARAEELELRVEELAGELLESRGACAQQHRHFTEQIRALEAQVGEREQIMQERLEAEQQRAEEAREALEELMSEVEGMSSALEAEKARAGSLGAALSTTREMLRSLKAQAAERSQAVQDSAQRAQEAEGAARELSAGLQATRQEAQLREERATKELGAARKVVEKLSGRISFLEQELAQCREASKETWQSPRQGQGGRSMTRHRPQAPQADPKDLSPRAGVVWPHQQASWNGGSHPHQENELSSPRRRLFAFERSQLGWESLHHHANDDGSKSLHQCANEDSSLVTDDSDAASVKHWAATSSPAPHCLVTAAPTHPTGAGQHSAADNRWLQAAAAKETPLQPKGAPAGAQQGSPSPGLQNQELADLVQEVKRMHSRLAAKNNQ